MRRRVAVEHILRRHPELKNISELRNLIETVVETPELVVEGRHREHIAIKQLDRPPFEGKHLVVAYEENGQVKTAFATGRVDKILRRPVLWKP